MKTMTDDDTTKTAPAAPDGTATDAATDVDSGGDSGGSAATGAAKGPEQKPGEIGGPKGPEPTRYGDWEFKGRCTDF